MYKLAVTPAQLSKVWKLFRAGGGRVVRTPRRHGPIHGALNPKALRAPREEIRSGLSLLASHPRGAPMRRLVRQHGDPEVIAGLARFTSKNKKPYQRLKELRSEFRYFLKHPISRIREAISKRTPTTAEATQDLKNLLRNERGISRLAKSPKTVFIRGPVKAPKKGAFTKMTEGISESPFLKAPEYKTVKKKFDAIQAPLKGDPEAHKLFASAVRRHEVSELGTQAGKKRFSGHLSLTPPLQDLNVAATLTGKGSKGASEAIRVMRKPEMKELAGQLGLGKPRYPITADRFRGPSGRTVEVRRRHRPSRQSKWFLSRGEPGQRMSRHAIKRLQQLYERPKP